MKNKFIIIALVIITTLFFSCDDQVEINYPIPEEPPALNLFQVDFNNETWIADSVVTTILNGVVTITSSKNNNEEVITMTINSDQVGVYELLPEQYSGNVIFQDLNDGGSSFITDETENAGTIEILENNVQNQKLSGQFFFIGKRTINGFDDLGNPFSIDEIIEFTNGVFENLVYTTSVVDVDDGLDVFYAKLNNIEFIEQTFSAIKTTENGISIITITATRDDNQETILFKLPADITVNPYVLTNITTDPAIDKVSFYSNSITDQTFGASPGLGSNDITLPSIVIIKHDIENKRLIANFEYTGFDLNSSDKVQLTEGIFRITYTE